MLAIPKQSLISFLQNAHRIQCLFEAHNHCNRYKSATQRDCFDPRVAHKFKGAELAMEIWWLRWWFGENSSGVVLTKTEPSKNPENLHQNIYWTTQVKICTKIEPSGIISPEIINTNMFLHSQFFPQSPNKSNVYNLPFTQNICIFVKSPLPTANWSRDFSIICLLDQIASNTIQLPLVYLHIVICLWYMYYLFNRPKLSSFANIYFWCKDNISVMEETFSLYWGGQMPQGLMHILLSSSSLHNRWNKGISIMLPKGEKDVWMANFPVSWRNEKSGSF